MEEEGLVQRVVKGGNTWYYLGNTPSADVHKRLDEQVALFRP